MQEKKNVMVIGTGGREHALIHFISKSPLVGKIYSNSPNFSPLAQYVEVDLSNFLNLAFFCKENNIYFVVIGPEKYLIEGIVDLLSAEGILAFGPNKSAAKLEASKSFTKELCLMKNIPTAKNSCFTEAKAAKEYATKMHFPIVIKADGPAEGKGVHICETVTEANETIDAMLNGLYGKSSSTIVIEEFLEGQEISYFVLVDGNNVYTLGSAYDYKQVKYEDKVYNTGGMGSFTSDANIDKTIEQEIMRRIIYPPILALKDINIGFKGVLFAGIILTNNGPKLLEYNVRFGDPETQVLLEKLDCDLLDLLIKTAQGRLPVGRAPLKSNSAVCVVLASKGYPQDFEKGFNIKGLDQASQIPDVKIYYAGVKLTEDNQILTEGGRVLNVVATGANLAEAREKAYKAVQLIDWPEKFYLENIGEQNS